MSMFVYRKMFSFDPCSILLDLSCMSVFVYCSWIWRGPQFQVCFVKYGCGLLVCHLDSVISHDS